jgi:hypothetical protein
VHHVLHDEVHHVLHDEVHHVLHHTVCEDDNHLNTQVHDVHEVHDPLHDNVDDVNRYELKKKTLSN